MGEKPLKTGACVFDLCLVFRMESVFALCGTIITINETQKGIG